MAQCNPKSLREIACANGFECLDERGLGIVTAVIFCQILQANNPMAQCDANSIMQAACTSGISCLNEKELKIVLAQLACEILQSGGGSGTSCLLCGVGDPVDVPECTCALYYDKDAATFWGWDNRAPTPHWFPLIGP